MNNLLTYLLAGLFFLQCLQFILLLNKERVTSKQFRKVLINEIIIELQNNVLNKNLDGVFHPYVIKVYNNFKHSPDKWRIISCTLTNDEDYIWITNSLEHRTFYANKFCYTDNNKLNEIIKVNSELTQYDNLLLDAIYKTAKQRKEIVLTKLF